MRSKVLILNCFIKGWNILKSLADDGFEVYGGDSRKKAPGLFSNRIMDKSRNLIYPDPKIDEEAFVNGVLEYVSREKIDILLPVNSTEMMALARFRDKIDQSIIFPFENYHKLLLLHDKKYFHELISGCCGNQFLPRSWSIGDHKQPIDEILKAAGLEQLPFQSMPNFADIDGLLSSHPALTYPLMVKTRRATSAVGVQRVNNEKELRQICAEHDGSDLIIQENLIGRGVGISFVRWTNPAVMYHFGHKRVREYPISGGASTSREVWDCDNHPLLTVITDLLDKLNWHGVIMFEFKEVIRQENDFEYRFLEANPRFWGSVPLAIANGVNFPVILCRAALGRDAGPVNNLKNIRARILFSDTLSLLLNIFHGRRIFYNLCDYLNFRHLRLDDIDLHDLSATRRVLRQMVSEFLRNIFRKS